MFSPLNLVNGTLILLILAALALVWSSGLDAGPEPLDIGLFFARR